MVGAVVLIGAVAVAVVLIGWPARNPGPGRMVVPRRVDGVVLDDGAGIQAGADVLRDLLTAGVPLKATVAAVYADASGAPTSVIFAAGTGVVTSPRAALGKAFTMVAASYGGIGAAADVAPGRLGGVMRCGFTATEGSSTVAICGWADHSSVGMAVFPNRQVPQSAGVLRAIREAIRSDGSLASAGADSTGSPPRPTCSTRSPTWTIPPP